MHDARTSSELAVNETGPLRRIKVGVVRSFEILDGSRARWPGGRRGNNSAGYRCWWSIAGLQPSALGSPSIVTAAAKSGLPSHCHGGQGGGAPRRLALDARRRRVARGETWRRRWFTLVKEGRRAVLEASAQTSRDRWRPPTPSSECIRLVGADARGGDGAELPGGVVPVQ